MLFRKCTIVLPMIFAACGLFGLEKNEKPLPEKILKIMHQEKYEHASWGLFAKDLTTGEVLYDLNRDQMFLPASTTKLFSIMALLHAYGDTYRFKTPVFAIGKIKQGRLKGNLVLVGQGDLTMGGRQGNTDQISFTKLDHLFANTGAPDVSLTPEDPMQGLLNLAKQISSKGIKEINGDVLIDNRLFEVIQKRELMLSPLLINENMIDLVINPTTIGEKAKISWRPEVTGYTVENKVKTVSKDEQVNLQVTSDPEGRNIVITGTIPEDKKDVVRTFAIKDPGHFARAAFIDALRREGIVVNLPRNKKAELPSQKTLQKLQPIAVYLSPPLSEYAKLTLKVSQNVGADLVPMLLAAQEGKKTFDEGMKILGNFVINEVKIESDAFVFGDAAGGDENRLTPFEEVHLLDYVKKLPSNQFQNFYNALPILGVDGSLSDFAKNTAAVGKVRAKTGTGVEFNAATGEFFLTTQTLAGYVEGKNGHMIAFMLAVNNGVMPKMDDLPPIFEDLSQIASIIYDLSETNQVQGASPPKN